MGVSRGACCSTQRDGLPQLSTEFGRTRGRLSLLCTVFRESWGISRGESCRNRTMILLLQSVAALALSLGPTFRPALLPRRCPAPIAEAVSTSLSTVDAAKIFGRLAEKTLYLDATVGACCHSACSDCEWRTPGGGYRWDIMKAQVAKWLPCYLTRDFADERALAFGYLILPECNAPSC